MATKLLQRWATISLDASDLKKIKRDDAGFIRIPVFATRTGVFNYVRPDGSLVREGRLPEEVFAKDSIDSMRGLPVTNNHPAEGLLDSKNAKKNSVGFSSDLVDIRDGKFVATEVTVTDEPTIQDVLAGKREISMGYQVARDETPGNISGEKFDVIQRKIRYNHLAIVNKGRAGPEVRFRLDAAENQLLPEEEKVAKKIKIDKNEFEVSDEAFDAISKLQKDNIALTEKIKKLEAKKDSGDEGVEAVQTKLDEMTKERDQLQAKLDASEVELKKAKESKPTLDKGEVDQIARERSRVERVARQVLDEKDHGEIDSLSTADLKKRIIKADAAPAEEKKDDDQKIDFDKKSEAYLDARFDVIAERALTSNLDETQNMGRKFTKEQKEKNDEVDKKETDAKKDAEDAWRTPLSMTTEQQA